MAVIKINGEELLSNYIREKVANELGNTVKDKEFGDFVTALLQELNNSKSNNIYLLEDAVFKNLCQNTMNNPSTNIWKKELRYRDGILISSMPVKSNLNEIKEGYQKRIAEFMKSYFEQKVADRTSKKFGIKRALEISNEEKTIKRTAAYITEKIMQQYVNLEILDLKWPEDRRDVIKDILEDDLGSELGVAGTKEKFLKFYKDTVKKMEAFVKTGEQVFISNDPKYKYAYKKYSELVRYYPFLRYCTYDENRPDDVQVNVFAIEGIARLRRCVGIDSCDNGKIYACEEVDIKEYDYQIFDDYLYGRKGECKVISNY